MEASFEYPKYRCMIKTKQGIYNVSDILISCQITEYKDDLARGVTVTLPNLKDGNNYMYHYLKVGDIMSVFCNTGEGYKEIFRGTVWEINYESSKEKNITIMAYDRLIYLQNTKDNFFFAKGKSTKSILQVICKRWGIKLDFQYQNISHKRTIIRDAYVSDAILEILEQVRRKKGTKYVVSFQNGVMTIKNRGKNKKIYTINRKESALKETTKVTMNGMVTKVAIYKEQEMQGNKIMPMKKVTELKGNTKKYGTLQQIVVQGYEGNKLAEAKEEAGEILKDHGKPKYERTLVAVNNPYIRKGDKIWSNAGALEGYYTVAGIEHDCVKGTMNLEVEK